MMAVAAGYKEKTNRVEIIRSRRPPLHLQGGLTVFSGNPLTIAV